MFVDADIFVCGERLLGAISCVLNFRDDGAFKSHFCRGGLLDVDIIDAVSLLLNGDGLSCTVESGISIIAGGGGAFVFVIGRSIGTNADRTISSSESSDEFSWFEFISMDEFILCDMLFVDGGLDDDGRDEAGDSRDELRWSTLVGVGGVKGLLCKLVKARPDTVRRFAKS